MKRLERSVARAGALIAVAAAAVAVIPATASAVTTPPLTITASTSGPLATGSTTNFLGDVGVTYGITYTLKASSADTLTGVNFTDALPAGAQLDDEVGETAKNCGTPFNPVNQAGATSVTETGLTVIGSAAAGYVGSCTITLEFVDNSVETSSLDNLALTAGGYSVNNGTTTTNATTATLADLSLTVAALPTLSETGVTNNATYGYGQSVLLGFGATPASNDSIAANGVYATDDQGNTLATGQAVNTDVPGSHQVQVWVQTVDGYLGSQTYSYNVNSPKLTSVTTTKNGDVDFDVEYLAAGSVAAEFVDGKTVIGTVTKKVSVGKSTAVTVAPTVAGKKALTKLTTVTKKVKEKYKVRIKVKVKVHGKTKTKVETKTRTKTVTKTTVKAIKVTLSVLYTATDWSYIGTQPTITKAGITLK